MTYPTTTRNVPSRYRERATYDRDAVHAVLDEAYVCHLGFVADGEPRVLPTLFVRVGETVYLHGATAATPMLAARPGGIAVTFAVTSIDALVLARSQFHHSANYRSVVAHGVATLVTGEAAKRAAMTALVEKVGPGRSGHTRPPTARELASTAVLALPLEDVSMKRRAHGAVDDEEDLTLPYWAGIVPLRLTTGYGVAEPGVDVAPPPYVRVRSPWLEPAALRGEHVVLDPLRPGDAAELFTALDDEEVWRHMTVPRPGSAGDMARLVEGKLARAAADALVPWTIRDTRTGEIVGTTAYYDIDQDRETVCVGHTQVARARWRTEVNTEAKLLLLTRAFETLGAGRVEWHTDIRNERSQTAVARLGAVREGVLRRHRRRGDGTWRDTVVFAMTVDGWPAARDRLASRLAAGQTVASCGE